MKKTLTILFSLFLCMTTLSAQADFKVDKSHKERIEQIKAAKIAYFTDEMKLSPDDAKVFWPVYNKYSEEIRLAQKESHECYGRMMRLKDENIAEPEVKKLLMELQNSHEKINQIEKIYLDEFLKILPAEKVARMYIAEEGFRIRMINMWKGGPKQR
ncbi:MAG: hypothetical protein HUJ89_01905 [Bacteroidales bacterium]|nr:hypothetical protein [Bacteroidales bacterium]